MGEGKAKIKNKKAKINISAVVLTGKANKKLLSTCLKSLSWCDEIIKIEGKKGSFADWRNKGASRAKGDWLFYVDADEEVPQNLRLEIEKLIENRELRNENYAYAVPRRNFIFGKEFKYGGQWPDYVKRLFLRSKFKGWRGELHEEPFFTGPIGHLENPLIHHKDISISQMVEKTNNWSEIEAKLMFKANHPQMNILRFFAAGFREFWLRMVRQMAFLDGKEGIIYALYQVYSRLISYAKLWELQEKVKNQKAKSKK